MREIDFKISSVWRQQQHTSRSWARAQRTNEYRREPRPTRVVEASKDGLGWVKASSHVLVNPGKKKLAQSEAAAVTTYNSRWTFKPVSLTNNPDKLMGLRGLAVGACLERRERKAYSSAACRWGPLEGASWFELHAKLRGSHTFPEFVLFNLLKSIHDNTEAYCSHITIVIKSWISFNQMIMCRLDL